MNGKVEAPRLRANAIGLIGLAVLGAPGIGIGIDAYLIYKSFFVSLWGAGMKTGRSIVLFSLALVAVSILYVLYLKLTNPDRLTGSSIDHLTTEPEPGIHA